MIQATPIPVCTRRDPVAEHRAGVTGRDHEYRFAQRKCITQLEGITAEVVGSKIRSTLLLRSATAINRRYLVRDRADRSWISWQTAPIDRRQ